MLSASLCSSKKPLKMSHKYSLLEFVEELLIDGGHWLMAGDGFLSSWFGGCGAELGPPA